MRYYWALSILLLLVSSTAFGQVVPDTVYRKPSLPTGPPGDVPAQPIPRTQPRPPVLTQPPVSTQQEDTVEYEEEEKVPILDRLYYGGGFGLQFGTFTNVSLSPILGYMFNEKLWAGGGIIYDYLGGRGVSLQNYGGKAFAQFVLVENFLMHAEYDLVNVENFRGNNLNDKYREFVGIPLAGLGYRQLIGTRASADFLVLYNFETSSYSLYSNPVIRFSFNIPFRR
ncbi:hypothetical protein [Botryobacter ruber]|uniref:hypothetical protein n=1 Tax=Botryobacter ruber TaxID=2171629 RepID=UPI001F0C3D0F|nr:hypothetical protein [Botryobacter ruber]